MLQQLEAVCRESQQFRALNLDIACPAHLPHLTSCACVVKSRAGEVVRRENGTAGYTVRVPVIVMCDICNNVVPGMWMWEVPPAELRLAARHHQVDTTLQQIFCIDLGTQSASSASKSLCFIDIAIFVSSIWQYSQSRSSCCSKEDRRGGSLAPDVAATTAEQNSQVHMGLITLVVFHN